MSDNEFSHILLLSEIGDGQTVALAANEQERAALAVRFDLLSLERLEAQVTLSREHGSIAMRGELSANAQQRCVASGEAVAADIHEAIDIRICPPAANSPDAEIELEADDCDIVFHDGKIVDIGEAVAQSFALALDPYPRSRAAAQILRDAGVVTEEEERAASGPFAALAELKRGK